MNLNYTIENYIRKTYEPGELKDPYLAELKRIQKKKEATLEEYVRYFFINGCRGFWAVTYEQNIGATQTPAEIYKKVHEEEAATGVYHDWPGLLNWCRCFAIKRMNYETAALNYLATLNVCVREDAILRDWAGHVQDIEKELEEKGVDVSDIDPDIFNVWNFQNRGFKVPQYYIEKVYNGTTQSFEKFVGEQKLKSLTYAKNGIVAMIKFLRLADVFIEMLGKALKFDPSAFKSSPSRWNEIIFTFGGIAQSVEMWLFDQERPGTLKAGVEETKAVWRGILDEIKKALDHVWTAKELKPLKDKLKRDPFHFFEAPSDVDFILEIFGAEKDY